MLLAATDTLHYNVVNIQEWRWFLVLNENIKAIRKAKGLSQEELAIKLNVVRQTVSKWENGLSVPDSDMLLAISETLDTPVSTLLGTTVQESEPNELQSLAEKLELVNLQLAKRKIARQKALHWLCILLCVAIIAIAIILLILQSPYLGWDYSDPETAVMGVAYHTFEWIFVRVAPIVFIGAVIGVVLTYKKR